MHLLLVQLTHSWAWDIKQGRVGAEAEKKLLEIAN